MFGWTPFSTLLRKDTMLKNNSGQMYRYLSVAVIAFAIFLLPPNAAIHAQDITPEKVRAALPRLEKLAEQTLKKTGVPGMAIAVVYRDEVMYLKGFGVRQVGKNEPVNADTVFQLASVSKPIASTILALLVGLGIIDWDDPIVNHDPGFQMFDPWVTRKVTFRDLLCHRSGLPDHGGDLLEDLGYDRAEVLHRLRFLKPASSFRSTFAYTNFGYTEAAVAGARAAKMSWEDLAAEKLFRPLGMNSTSARFKDYADAKNRAILHVRANGEWHAKYTRNADAQSPAGGVSSTVRDMAQWLRLQLDQGKYDGKQLISASALAETHRPQIISHIPGNPAKEQAGFYGLGWNVNYGQNGEVRLGHSGAFDMGAATNVSMLPAEKLGIVVLTNSSPIGVPETISASFFDLVQHGKIEKDWLNIIQPAFAALSQPTYGTTVDYSKPRRHKSVSPFLPLPSYTGTYDNSYFGPIEVKIMNNQLIITMGPKHRPYGLKHWNRDTFLYQPVGEMSAGLSAVTFRMGVDGRADSVLIENLDGNRQGTFRRK